MTGQDAAGKDGGEETGGPGSPPLLPYSPLTPPILKPFYLFSDPAGFLVSF